MNRIETVQAELEAIYADLLNYIKKQAQGKKLVGYNCSYFPIHLFDSENFYCIRIPIIKPFKVGSIIQSYVCSVARGMAEAVLSSGLDFDMIVMTDSCDSMKMMGDTLSFHKKNLKVVYFQPPTNMVEGESETFLKKELFRFKENVEKVLEMNIEEEKIENRIKELHSLTIQLANLEDSYYAFFPQISNRLLFLIRFLSFYIPHSKMINYIKIVLKELKGKEFTGGKAGGKKSPRLVLSGSFISSPLIFDIFDKTGVIVLDDTCLYRRHYFYPLHNNRKWFEYETYRLINKRICPCFHKKGTPWFDQVRTLISRYGADGVVFYVNKYCDPHESNYPLLKKMLDERGIKSIKIEADDTDPASGKIENKIETFVELIKED